MDEKQKKMLVILLAVVGLGAGGYFVFLRDSGPAANQGNTGVTQGRAKRATAAPTSADKGRTKRAAAKRAKAAPTGRATRAKATAKKTTRAKRGAGKRAIKKKKKKLAPAA